MVNKCLSKLANNKTAAKCVIGIGMAFSTISNLTILAGIYYLAIRNGVELRDEYYESEDN